MITAFTENAFIQYQYWASFDKAIFNRINELLKDISRQPFKGIGKPEPLKHSLKGWWSRRINDEHRLVYRIENKSIVVLSCRYHYD